jgi:tetrapyrrole methylase family protein/MazG family protein
VVGLGPAGTPYLSNTVVSLMESAPATLVRTLRHPAAENLVGVESLDRFYDGADTFEQVYAAIVEELIAVARRHAPAPIVYAVPGSPLVAERTVELLRADARVDMSVIPSLSFLDLAWERLGIDPLHGGVRLVDAECFAEQTEGAIGPVLVAQCWSQTLLSEIKLSAGEEAVAGLPEVVLLHHLGLDDERIESVNWWEMDRTVTPDHLTSLFVPRWPASSPRRVLRGARRARRARCRG